MVTAVSQFIEQVGSMIKGMPKPNYHLLTKLQRASIDTCQQANLPVYQFIVPQNYELI